jgi:DNA replication protein DnaC
MEYWNSLDCLFIDELDKVNGTGWAQTIMFEVLDRRYVRAVREEALTVIASNKKDDELDGYLVDRLHDKRISKIVYLNGESARPLMPAGYKY